MEITCSKEDNVMIGDELLFTIKNIAEDDVTLLIAKDLLSAPNSPSSIGKTSKAADSPSLEYQGTQYSGDPLD